MFNWLNESLSTFHKIAIYFFQLVLITIIACSRETSRAHCLGRRAAKLVHFCASADSFGCLYAPYEIIGFLGGGAACINDNGHTIRTSRVICGLYIESYLIRRTFLYKFLRGYFASAEKRIVDVVVALNDLQLFAHLHKTWINTFSIHTSLFTRSEQIVI